MEFFLQVSEFVCSKKGKDHTSFGRRVSGEAPHDAEPRSQPPGAERGVGGVRPKRFGLLSGQTSKTGSRGRPSLVPLMYVLNFSRHETSCDSSLLAFNAFFPDWLLHMALIGCGNPTWAPCGFYGSSPKCGIRPTIRTAHRAGTSACSFIGGCPYARKGGKTRMESWKAPCTFICFVESCFLNPTELVDLRPDIHVACKPRLRRV